MKRGLVREVASCDKRAPGFVRRLFGRNYNKTKQEKSFGVDSFKLKLMPEGVKIVSKLPVEESDRIFLEM
jgi:hypothetical protein